MDMTAFEKWLEKWVAIREQGKLLFILKYGLLRFGLPFAILFFLSDYFGLGRFIIFSEPKEPDVAPYWLSVLLAVWKFGVNLVGFGTIAGLYVWYRNEHQFRKLQRLREAQSDSTT